MEYRKCLHWYQIWLKGRYFLFSSLALTWSEAKIFLPVLLRMMEDQNTPGSNALRTATARGWHTGKVKAFFWSGKLIYYSVSTTPSKLCWKSVGLLAKEVWNSSQLHGSTSELVSARRTQKWWGTVTGTRGSAAWHGTSGISPLMQQKRHHGISLDMWQGPNQNVKVLPCLLWQMKGKTSSFISVRKKVH